MCIPRSRRSGTAAPSGERAGRCSNEGIKARDVSNGQGMVRVRSLISGSIPLGPRPFAVHLARVAPAIKQELRSAASASAALL